jgi:hypothetical protein
MFQTFRDTTCQASPDPKLSKMRRLSSLAPGTGGTEDKGGRMGCLGSRRVNIRPTEPSTRGKDEKEASVDTLKYVGIFQTVGNETEETKR